MRLNLAQKIFGVAFIVLLMMVVAAIHSIRLTERISNDLHAIAHKHMPAAMAISRINEHILEQGILLQRILLSARDHDPEGVLSEEKKRFQELADKISSDFSNAKALLNDGARSSRVVEMDLELLAKLDAIEKHYLNFEQQGLSLVGESATLSHEAFLALDQALDIHQDQLDKSVDALNIETARLADTAVESADKDEKQLLWMSILLTVLAVILALLVAVGVSRILVRSVRNLVKGTEDVETGNYNTRVPVISADEVGKLTIAFNSMVEGLSLRERIKETFGKYMDPRIVSGLMNEPEFTREGGEKREMTVMFIDLKGFTSISEILQPDDLVFMVNDFFSYMTDAIASHQGVVDKYMGDAVMAYWGPPFCKADEHALLACRAGLEALSQLDKFREHLRVKLGDQADGIEIDLRIGISTGEMVVGSIGSNVSKNFTVMGNPVNLGSRLEGANKSYGTRILISDETRQHINNQLATREIDLIRVKGKLEPTRVHELLPQQGEWDKFAQGLQAYRAQSWDQAEELFSHYTDDPASQAYLQRIAQLREESNLPEAWDGVWVFQTK